VKLCGEVTRAVALDVAGTELLGGHPIGHVLPVRLSIHPSICQKKSSMNVAQGKSNQCANFCVKT